MDRSRGNRDPNMVSSPETPRGLRTGHIPPEQIIRSHLRCSVEIRIGTSDLNLLVASSCAALNSRSSLQRFSLGESGWEVVPNRNRVVFGLRLRVQNQGGEYSWGSKTSY